MTLIRGGTQAAALASTYVPTSREIVGATDTGALWLGNGTQTVANLPQPYVRQGSQQLDLRKQPGVVGDGTTDDTAAINTAAASAASLGLRLFGTGTFATTGTVTLACDCDMAGALFNYSGTGTAVLVGTSAATFITRKRMMLPRVVATAKTALGWAQVAGSIGVDVSNAYAHQIYVPHIGSFETGLRMYGHNSLGTSYCTVNLGHLDNNKTNLLIDADSATTGYCNQNTFIGGRYGHNSGEGPNAAGTCHIRLADITGNADPNNNVFLNPSIESPTVVEFAIDVAGGSYNIFVNPRLEFTSGTAKVRWGAGAVRNLILGGNQIDTMVETWVTGATLNNIVGTNFHRLMTSGTQGGLVLENTAGNTSPALSIMRATGTQLGDVPNTAYGMRFEYNVARLKRYNETFERVRLDGNAGRVYLGDGTAAPLSSFYGLGAFLFVGSGATTFGFETDNASDVGGATNYRPRYVRAATAIQTAAVATASRPAAATARAGAMVFDTTLNKPIWSTGTVWVDATGTTV